MTPTKEFSLVELLELAEHAARRRQAIDYVLGDTGHAERIEGMRARLNELREEADVLSLTESAL